MIGLIEPRKGVDCNGARGCEIFNFIFIDGGIAKQRIGENLNQLRLRPGLLIARKASGINIKHLNQFNENLRRDRTLVALD